MTRSTRYVRIIVTIAAPPKICHAWPISTVTIFIFPSLFLRSLIVLLRATTHHDTSLQDVFLSSRTPIRIISGKIVMSKRVFIFLALEWQICGGVTTS